MIHIDTFTINSFQVDWVNRVTPSVLFGMMQECASLYCIENKIGIEDLAKNNLTWMLARQYVKFSRFPAWGSRVTVETWPRTLTGLRALRDFMVTDENGNEVARSVTNWMLIDKSSRRLCKIDETVKHLVPVEKSVMDSGFKIRVEKFEGSGTTALFRVRPSDFDINSHVNNIIYIRWVLDTLPLEFHRNHILSEVSAEYIEEISDETDIESIAVRKEGSGEVEFYHELKNLETGRIVCRCYTAWQAQR